MIIYKKTQKDPIETLYNRYIWECIRSKDFTIFKESELDEGVKEVWKFIKELATSATLKVGDLVKALKNKSIFTFFASLGFNPRKVAEAFKGVYELTKKITHFIPGSIAKALEKGWKNLPDETREKIIDGVKKADKFIKGMGKFGNVVFACFLVWIWLQAGLVGGDVAYDFDISEPLDALRGRLSVTKFFLGDNEDGTNKDGSVSLALEYLGLIIYGKMGIGGIIPYAQFSNATFLTISLIQYLAKEIGIKIQKGRNSTAELEKAQKSFA
jgi:hypothetical protein